MDGTMKFLLSFLALTLFSCSDLSVEKPLDPGDSSQVASSENEGSSSLLGSSSSIASSGASSSLSSSAALSSSSQVTGPLCPETLSAKLFCDPRDGQIP
jgi:hypothetical protein